MRGFNELTPADLKALSDEERAELRFTQPAAGIVVTFLPQCATCKKSIELLRCKAFQDKPVVYLENGQDCPEREG